jgi:hypothetical protein
MPRPALAMIAALAIVATGACRLAVAQHPAAQAAQIAPDSYMVALLNPDWVTGHEG